MDVTLVGLQDRRKNTKHGISQGKINGSLKIQKKYSYVIGIEIRRQCSVTNLFQSFITKYLSKKYIHAICMIDRLNYLPASPVSDELFLLYEKTQRRKNSVNLFVKNISNLSWSLAKCLFLKYV